MEPDDEGIVAELGGASPLWIGLVARLASRYDHEPVMVREGTDPTWTVRYRKGGKTLVTLYPGKGGFVVLVVLGKEEVAKARAVRLGGRVKEALETAKQFHDGRWLWIRPSTEADIESIMALLAVKRRPKQP
jgi:hypothetical protein